MALLRGRPWVEVVVSGLGAVALAWAATVLLPLASAIYSRRGVLFQSVKFVVDLTTLQPETVVAGAAGAVTGLFVLYFIDEAKRALAALIVVVVGLVVVPELRQLNRVVDAVGSQLLAFLVVGIIMAVTVGGVSARIYPSVPLKHRSTLAYIKWANFRLASNILYVVAVGWTILVTGQYLLTGGTDPPPGTVAGTGVVILAAATFFFRYENQSSVVVIGVDDRSLVPYVVSGLYTIAKKEYDGFSVEGDVDQMSNCPEAQLPEYVGQRAVFSYRPGQLLKRTVRVEADGSTVQNINIKNKSNNKENRNKLRVFRENIRQLSIRLLPHWLVEYWFRPDRSTLNKCDISDVVVLSVRYPNQSVEPNETFRKLCKLYDGLLSPTVIVALTHAPQEDEDQGVQAQTGAQRLKIEELSCPIVPVNRDNIDDEEFGGFKKIINKL